MSKLVEKYFDLSKKVFSGAEAGESVDKIRDEMQEVKKQFSAEDWDELIASVPVHIRPMVAEQKKKYIND